MNNRKYLSVLTCALFITGANTASATIRKCESATCRDDTKITASIQAILDSHSEFGPPNSISAQTSEHVVYLRGMVDTGLEKWTAESVASQVPGVARVVNSLVERN
jgi:osmotically-inducible protein OsmY